MSKMIETEINTSNVIDSNLFLRALWSEIRVQFGKCSWNFIPVINKHKKEISLGIFETNHKDLSHIEATIIYKNKGGIYKMKFESKNDLSLLEELILNIKNTYKSKLKNKVSHFI